MVSGLNQVTWDRLPQCCRDLKPSKVKPLLISMLPTCVTILLNTWGLQLACLKILVYRDISINSPKNENSPHIFEHWFRWKVGWVFKVNKTFLEHRSIFQNNLSRWAKYNWKSHKMFPYSLSSIFEVSGSPGIPNWLNKNENLHPWHAIDVD